MHLFFSLFYAHHCLKYPIPLYVMPIHSNMTGERLASPLVPRYRSEWQDHVGTSALRCRPLASYVPLCSDLSGSASCTAPCIAGRQLHIRSLPVLRDGDCIPGLCLQREMAVAYTFSSPIPSAFLCLCYYPPYPYLHGTVKPVHASPVPRYRSE